MADFNEKELIKNLLVRPIQLADQICKFADEASSFKQECQEFKTKSEKLAALLRQVARASTGQYTRPTRRIVDDTEQVLDKAFALVLKCRGNSLMKRVFTIIPAAAFRKTATQLENSIGDISWLLRVSAPSDERDDEYLGGLPPIASNEPILCLIWEQIAILHMGNVEERSDAAASLVSLARDNDRYGKLIIEEGGIPPLLKLAKESYLEGQESAARAIGLLGRDPESVEQIVNSGACPVFAKILKADHMKVQSTVAWTVSELAENHPKCQDHFVQTNTIRYLVSHLAFETIQEHSRYAIPKQQNMGSLHSVVVASANSWNPNDNSKGINENKVSQFPRPMGNQSQKQMLDLVANAVATKKAETSEEPIEQYAHTPQVKVNHNQTNQVKGNHQNQHTAFSGTSINKGREYDAATKAQMKAMAARALWKLSKGNVTVCRSITESKALLCFAVLLEKGEDEVQSYSAMALAEITSVAEQYADLRRSAFKPTSPAAKAVVDKLLRVIIEAEYSDLLIPCIKSIGNLARTFRASESRVIPPLVNLLEETEPEVSAEAATALTNFACTENFLHENHSKAIISAGGVKHLIQLVYFGEQMVQIPSLILLCYISLHVPDSEVLAQDEVLVVLEWATKQAHLNNDPSVELLLSDAKSRLELYQSTGSRAF